MTVLGLNDRIKHTDAAAPHGHSGRSERRDATGKNPSVVAIQKFIVTNFKLPIGKNNNMTPDGGFGPVTNEALKKIVSEKDAIQDPELKAIVEKMAPFVGHTPQESSLNIPKLENAIVGKGPSADGLAKRQETYNVDIALPGEAKKSFPLAYAITSKQNLEYVLIEHKFVNRSDPPPAKIEGAQKGVDAIIEALPDNPNMQKVKDWLRFRANELIEFYQSKTNEQNIMTYLRQAFGEYLAFLPPGDPLESKISEKIYTLNPSSPYLSDPTPNAKIVDLPGMLIYKTQILSFLVRFRDTYSTSGGKR